MTGNFTGTTDEIIQWVACNRGIDENLIRAEATLESYWVQSTQGDFANGKYHSFGLMQVSHDDANGATQVKGDMWGCVGYWYSGNWYDAGANQYIASVKNYYNTKPWIGWGYPGK